MTWATPLVALGMVVSQAKGTVNAVEAAPAATFTVEVTADPTSLTAQAPSKIVYTVGDPFDAATERIEEALCTGAEALVSTEPWSEKLLADTIAANGGALKVYDLVELVAQATEEGGR